LARLAPLASAQALGLLTTGVGPGDEVITVSHTAGATVAAIHMIDAVPVLVDVCEDTYCVDARVLDTAISFRTKAVLPVHLYGHPADLASIGAIARRCGVPTIEGCAQAQEASIDGGPVGTLSVRSDALASAVASARGIAAAVAQFANSRRRASRVAGLNFGFGSAGWPDTLNQHMLPRNALLAAIVLSKAV
jgi:hypothetical protein